METHIKKDDERIKNRGGEAREKKREGEGREIEGERGDIQRNEREKA